MAKTNPTARTLEWCRKLGMSACVVEKWIPQTKQRKDAFGWIDVLAVGDGWMGAIGIQSTSATNAAARITKILAIPDAVRWLQAGNVGYVHGWRKNASNRWVCNVWKLGLQDGQVVAARVDEETVLENPA